MQPELVEQPRDPRATEVEEKLHHRLGRVRLNQVRRLRIKDVGVTRTDFVRFPTEPDGAPAPPDHLDGDEGEVVTVNGEIGRAPLASPADKAQAMVGTGLHRPIRHEKPARSNDLLGKVSRRLLDDRHG